MTTFQTRVHRWCVTAFGKDDAENPRMRSLRFLEEAMELAQAMNISKEEARRVLEYVFGKPTGEVPQELGGVMVTLSTLAQSQKLKMYQCGENELVRCWQRIETIRQRHAAKPKFDGTDTYGTLNSDDDD